MPSLIVTSSSSLDHITEQCQQLGLWCGISRVWVDGFEPFAYQICIEDSPQAMLILIRYSDSVSVSNFAFSA